MSGVIFVASPATTRLVTYCVIVLTLVSQNYVEALQSQAAGPPESMFTVYKHSTSEMNTEYWLKQGRQSLERALKYQPIVNQAKNGILFIGDGMSLSTITAARILFGQQHNRSGEESALSFEQLPNVALLKTYNVDQQIPDSAATATALLSGVKTNFYTLGVNAHVRLNDTNCTSHTAHAVHSILKLAQDAGKSTGIVTNTRITHATPGAAFAHSSNRKWECDHYMPTNLGPECKDIARQLIEDKPGINLNVILGGGRRCFFGVSNKDPTEGRGYRRDDRNLIDLWVKQKRAANRFNYAFVNSTRDLRSIDPTRTDYLLGLFAYSHMAYEEMRDQSDDGEPSLAEMTETAIRILSRNPRGYVLLVEGGRIDHAHHENIAGVALRETIALSQAVQVARYLTNPLETLLAVTSDHAHALTINGLAPRGNSILGLSRFFENSSQIPYTTLLYGNGPGNQQPRRDPSLEPNSTETPFYVQHAAVHQEESFHDGGDVAVFALGPFSHLFQGVQEQTFVAHVFAFATCIGDYANARHCHNNNNNLITLPSTVTASSIAPPRTTIISASMEQQGFDTRIGLSRLEAAGSNHAMGANHEATVSNSGIFSLAWMGRSRASSLPISMFALAAGALQLLYALAHRYSRTSFTI